MGIPVLIIGESGSGKMCIRDRHTPVEVVDLEDIERGAKLMASYIHHR